MGPDDVALFEQLKRIATALERIVDYRVHTCGPCDGVGTVLVSYDKRDHLGMERDFTGADVVPEPLPQFEYSFHTVRVKCLHCDGTGRIVPREQPNLSAWVP